MLLLKVDNIVKHFGPEPVLDGASFEVRWRTDRTRRTKWGGKSTFTKEIVAGVDTSDNGTLELQSVHDSVSLEQHPAFEPGKTLWEEAESGLDHWIKLGNESERVAHELAANPAGAAKRSPCKTV